MINIALKNPYLIKQVARLRQAIELRQKAKSTGSYIKTCRFAATEVQGQVQELLAVDNVELFSLNELCSVRFGIYSKRLKQQIGIAVKHVTASGCTLCLAKGFYCETCRQSDLIFPFQVDKVHQCKECFACYHKKCFQQDKTCSKCIRRQTRSDK